MNCPNYPDSKFGQIFWRVVDFKGRFATTVVKCFFISPLELDKDMRVMVIIKATPSSEAGIMPDEKLMTEMGAFNEALMNAGVLISGDGLHPTSKGVRVHFDGTERKVIDGPFAETKELIAGFWIWEVASMEEAIAWIKRCPNPMPEPSIVEIRRVFEAADFGEAFSSELQAQEEQIRQKLEKRNGP